MSPRDRDEPRLLHRFHVRTTLLFGALAMSLLGATGFISYRFERDTELAALKARLRALAVALGEGLDGEAVRATLAEGRQGSPSHRALVERFAAIGEDEHDVSSIYVVVPSEREGFVRFAADWVRDGDPADVGQLYDARELDEMRGAFVTGAQVERVVKIDEWGPSLSGYAPVRDEHGEVMGVVGVDVSALLIVDIERKASLVTGGVFGAAVLLLFAVGAVFGRSVKRPIAQIVRASGAIAARDFSARVQLDRDDELGILARHFDRMAEGLEERERIRAVFGRYVSEDVARRVMSSPDADRLGGELREVTILFVHLARFAEISRGLAPAEVVAMLEHYLSAMVELIEANGGCVVELLGDGLLAVFGAPAELSNHPEAAVLCARAMKARMPELEAAWAESGLAARWRERGIEELRLKIGVHLGTVVAGNTGGASRMKYAVIGDAVNVAARVEGLNDRLGTSLLVSSAVQERLPAELAAHAKPRGEQSVKGRQRSVEVFEY
jgi:adenylate cyclase